MKKTMELNQKKLNRNSSLGFCFAFLLSLPLLASAQRITVNLTSFISPGSIEELLLAILNVFVIVATPIIVIFIIYAGFLYVTARGNAEQVKQATRALSYAIIGGVIIIGAVAIAEVLGNIVDEFRA